MSHPHHFTVGIHQLGLAVEYVGIALGCHGKSPVHIARSECISGIEKYQVAAFGSGYSLIHGII